MPTSIHQPPINSLRQYLQESEIDPGNQVDHTSTEEGCQELLDSEGVLHFEGWSTQNKIQINHSNIKHPFNFSLLNLFSYKQFDEIQLEVNGWRIELLGV